MSANFVMVDPELKRHCEAVKYQKASMKDLAEYYVSYMDRMGKEADPKVKAKLASKEYSDNIQPFAMGYGMPGATGSGNPFPGHQPGFGNMPGFPQPPGGPSFGGPGGFNMGGNPGHGAAPGYGGAPGGGHAFGGAGGFNMGGGAGYHAQAPQQGNLAGQPAQPFGAPYGNNPFATAPTQAQGGYGGFPMGAQGYQQPSSNPFGQPAPQMHAKPPMTSLNMQHPPAYGTQGYQQPQEQAPGKQFDDIFADPTVKAQNPAFGGDKKPAGHDTTDDFLKQLEDLKKL